MDGAIIHYTWFSILVYWRIVIYGIHWSLFCDILSFSLSCWLNKSSDLKNLSETSLLFLLSFFSRIPARLILLFCTCRFFFPFYVESTCGARLGKRKKEKQKEGKKEGAAPFCFRSRLVLAFFSPGDCWEEILAQIKILFPFYDGSWTPSWSGVRSFQLILLSVFSASFLFLSPLCFPSRLLSPLLFSSLLISINNITIIIFVLCFFFFLFCTFPSSTHLSLLPHPPFSPLFFSLRQLACLSSFLSCCFCSSALRFLQLSLWTFVRLAFVLCTSDKVSLKMFLFFSFSPLQLSPSLWHSTTVSFIFFPLSWFVACFCSGIILSFGDLHCGLFVLCLFCSEMWLDLVLFACWSFRSAQIKRFDSLIARPLLACLSLNHSAGGFLESQILGFQWHSRGTATGRVTLWSSFLSLRSVWSCHEQLRFPSVATATHSGFCSVFTYRSYFYLNDSPHPLPPFLPYDPLPVVALNARRRANTSSLQYSLWTHNRVVTAICPHCEHVPNGHELFDCPRYVVMFFSVLFVFSSLRPELVPSRTPGFRGIIFLIRLV